MGSKNEDGGSPAPRVRIKKKQKIMCVCQKKKNTPAGPDEALLGQPPTLNAGLCEMVRCAILRFKTFPPI